MTLRIIPSALLLILAAMFLWACNLVERTEPTPEPSPTAQEADTTPPPTATPVPSPTETIAPTPSPSPEPSPTPEPTPTSTPVAVPTPVPPVSRVVTETPCCGLFEWLDAERLLVYDIVPGSGEGAWRVDVQTGERSMIASGYGIPSASGIIAFPESGAGRLTLTDFNGEVIASVPNGGEPGWPSPDGESVAWLEDLPVRTPSSTVDRAVELSVADVADGQPRAVIQLQTSELHWLPDNRRVLVAARNLAFEESGIWLIDTATGEYEIVFEELFLRAVQLSPDGSRVAFMRTFNDDPHQNGIWVIDLVTREMNKVADSGAVRWNADSRHLWLLEMSDSTDGKDSLLRLDSDSGQRRDSFELDGRVLNDEWKISPDGSLVAYWRDRDGQIVVQSLPEPE